MRDNADLDNLPFAEYAAIVAEEGAKRNGKPGAPRLSFGELVASNLTFDEIKADYGEETAINVGIAQDPDAPEWTEEDWARARPGHRSGPGAGRMGAPQARQTKGPQEGADIHPARPRYYRLFPGRWAGLADAAQ